MESCVVILSWRSKLQIVSEPLGQDMGDIRAGMNTGQCHRMVGSDKDVHNFKGQV